MTTSDPSETAAVLAADDARLAALVRMDLDALEPLLADELVFVHTNGRRETKQVYLDALRSRHIQYRALARNEATVQLAAEVAVVTGTMRLEVTVNHEDRSADARFMSVWVKKDRAWRMVACDMVRAGS